ARNGWSACSEMAGQIGPKRLVGFERNGWSDSTEIRTPVLPPCSPAGLRAPRRFGAAQRVLGPAACHCHTVFLYRRCLFGSTSIRIGTAVVPPSTLRVRPKSFSDGRLGMAEVDVLVLQFMRFLHKIADPTTVSRQPAVGV